MWRTPVAKFLFRLVAERSRRVDDRPHFTTRAARIIRWRPGEGRAVAPATARRHQSGAQPTACLLVVLVVVVIPSLNLPCPADPPDDAGLRDLHERTIRWRPVATESRAGVALAEVAHRAVIDEVERAVGAEHRRHRPIDTAQCGRLDERLIPHGLA